jgi:predicted alternative tryptophan synthase beta-subunit
METEVKPPVIGLEEKAEVVARFLGGIYRATSKVKGKKFKVNVIKADIKNFDEIRKQGYKYDFRFMCDYNSLMPVLNKIIALGYDFSLSKEGVRIIKRDVTSIITIAEVRSEKIVITTMFSVCYKFATWYLAKEYLNKQ